MDKSELTQHSLGSDPCPSQNCLMLKSSSGVLPDSVTPTAAAKTARLFWLDIITGREGTVSFLDAIACSNDKTECRTVTFYSHAASRMLITHANGASRGKVQGGVDFFYVSKLSLAVQECRCF